MAMGEWLEKARNFTAAHTVVECGGYGYVAVSSIRLLVASPIGSQRPTASPHSRHSRHLSLHALHCRRTQVNSSLIDLGGNHTPCCFGRGGHVLYGRSSDLHLREARQAIADDDANVTRIYTGSQWVILDRAFCSYLVTDARALHWQRVFQRRFLSDESFVQVTAIQRHCFSQAAAPWVAGHCS